LAAGGFNVALLARTQTELSEVAEAIRSRGNRASVFTCDVSDPRSVASMQGEVLAQLGTPSIVVNNAGVAPSAKLEDTSDELWQQTIAVNLSGAFYISRAFVPEMKARGDGHIVMIASTAAMEGFAYTSAYTASKHGLLGLTRALAKELEKSGIKVNAVCPGFVRTRIVEESVDRLVNVAGQSPEQAEAKFAAMNKEGRLLEPAEIAETVWRLTKESSVPTGKAIDAHGMLLD
jgi:NAD(P)-dependent dehydrogenase (short-subunit alcohol dehydrogenase family)